MADLPRLTDEQMILAALHEYASMAESIAGNWPEGSRAWSEWMHRAQHANQLYVERSQEARNG